MTMQSVLVNFKGLFACKIPIWSLRAVRRILYVTNDYLLNKIGFTKQSTLKLGEPRPICRAPTIMVLSDFLAPVFFSDSRHTIISK